MRLPFVIVASVLLIVVVMGCASTAGIRANTQVACCDVLTARSAPIESSTVYVTGQYPSNMVITVDTPALPARVATPARHYLLPWNQPRQAPQQTRQQQVPDGEGFIYRLQRFGLFGNRGEQVEYHRYNQRE